MISIKKDTVEVTIVNNKPVIDKLSRFYNICCW